MGDGGMTSRTSAISRRGACLLGDLSGQTTEYEDREIATLAAGVLKEPTTLSSKVSSQAVRRSFTYERSMTRGSRKVVRHAAGRDSLPRHSRHVGPGSLGAQHVSNRCIHAGRRAYPPAIRRKELGDSSRCIAAGRGRHLGPGSGFRRMDGRPLQDAERSLELDHQPDGIRPGARTGPGPASAASDS